MKNLRFKQTFAFTCIFSLLTNIVYPTTIAKKLITSSVISSSGSGPVADAADGMVDLYTGDFRYSIPLLSVPGPNGENVGISIGYHGGIRMNEKASWIGLGWDYNPGEISRQVVGSPDDYNGQPVYSGQTIMGNVTTWLNPDFTYGPFNYENLNSFNTTNNSYLNDFTYPYSYLKTTKSCDMVTVENQIDNYCQIAMTSNTMTSFNSTFPPRYFSKPTAPYQAPAYDNYHLSGPGISGKLRPYIFKNAMLAKEKLPSYTGYNANKGKTQFHFENSTHKSVYQADAPDNRIKSGFFIKHFTNSEINNSGNLYNNATQTGFLDYRGITTTRRPSNEFDETGIGGIQVTAPNGITYHYSLPVYTQSEVGKSFNLYPIFKNDITLKTNNVEAFDVTCKKYKFANSWKLTAVTGPDYQDANNNKMADEGDKGYWISYNYSLWTNSFITASNIYNYSDGFVRQATQINRRDGYTGYMPLIHKKAFSNGLSDNQIYVLNYIRTATHTAYFIKDVRLDAHSYDNVLQSPSVPPTPLLKLKRIVLLRNQDKALIENNAPWKLSNVDSRFNSSVFTSPYDSKLIHIDKYNLNKSIIDFKSIKSIDFTTDYSLSKKLYDNINNTYSSTRVSYAFGNSAFCVLNYSSTLLYALVNKSSYSSTDPANSGKLTLNEINFYEDQALKVFPSYQFNYYKNNSADNPDYDGDKTDLWGYYKSDYSGLGDSHFTTPTSASNIHAWSLKEITTPRGENIKIEYEADEYIKEGFNNDPHYGFYDLPNPTSEMPKIIMPLNTFDKSNINLTFTFKDYNNILTANSTPNNCKLSYLVVPMQIGCTSWDQDPPPPYTTILTYLQGNMAQGTSTPQGDNALIVPGAFSHCNGVNSGIPGAVYKPDIWWDCNPDGSFNSHDYNKAIAMGYLLMKFVKLYGGGVRVKNIITTDPSTSDSYKRNYTYEGGYIPVVPIPFAIASQTEFSQYLLWDNVNLLLPEGGSSSIGYSKVTAKSINKYNISNGYTTFHFQNDRITNPLVTKASYAFNNHISCSCAENPPVERIQVAFQHFDITSTFQNKDIVMLGKIREIDHYNSDNKLVASTKYEYDDTKEIKETFPNLLESIIDIPFIFKCHNPNSNPTTWYFSCKGSERYKYFMYNAHCQPKLSKVTNMINDITTTTGYSYKSDINEAYKIEQGGQTSLNNATEKEYAYVSEPALGFKAINETNKNQVLLPSKIKTAHAPSWNTGYITGEKKVTYKKAFNYRFFNPSTGYYETTTQNMNWYTLDETFERLLDDKTLTSNINPGTYRLTSKTTLFSTDNSVIEERGLNDRPTCVKFGYNNLYKLSGISNANYNSFAFTGYEDTVTVAPGVVHFGGEINGGNYRSGSVYSQWITSGMFSIPVLTSIINPHTGNYFAKVPANAFGPTYRSRNFETDRKYRSQVWVHKNSPINAKLVLHLQGSDASNNPINDYQEISKNNSSNIQVGDWILMNLEINVPSSLDLTKTHSLAAYVWNLGTSDAYFDDFKFYPIDAPITGNVYDLKTGRLITVLDEENFATIFSYDAAGRTVSVYKETKTNGLVKLSEQGYHNSRP